MIDVKVGDVVLFKLMEQLNGIKVIDVKVGDVVLFKLMEQPKWYKSDRG